LAPIALACDSAAASLGRSERRPLSVSMYSAESVHWPRLRYRTTASRWASTPKHQDSADQSAFEDLDHANRVLGLVMEHYNNVARTLMERPDRYSPLFSVDTRNGDILLGALDRRLREGRRAAPGSLEEAARRRCRYGGGDERNAAACRHRNLTNEGLYKSRKTVSLNHLALDLPFYKTEGGDEATKKFLHAFMTANASVAAGEEHHPAYQSKGSNGRAFHSRRSSRRSLQRRATFDPERQQ
jgi:hypothetical protein